MNSNMTFTQDRRLRLFSDYNRSTKRISHMIKSEILNVTTPISKFQFAWICEPDTKFDPMGEWRITCLIDPEESQEIEKQLTDLLDRWKAQLKAANPSKKFKLAQLPWGFEEVTDGGETKPYFKVKAKTKVGGSRPDGTVWKNRPPALFNADGSPMTEEQKQRVNKCGPGTTGQVNLRCSGWETASFGVGIKLQIEAVMIKHHVEYARSATGYGFQTDSEAQTFDTQEAQNQEQQEAVAAADEF